MTDGFKTYESALDWLFYKLPTSSEQIFKADETLRVSSKLLARIGNLQNEFPTVHVAGTSGKGSTVTLVTDILLANSKHVGSILSPHVYDFRERLMVDGQFVARDEILNAINRLKRDIEELNQENYYPSYFQAVVALAYMVFTNHQIDYLVVETGIGGLYDTTNLIERDDKVVILNSIGLDHTSVLGDNIEEIAVQKAGIISKDSVVFGLLQAKPVVEVFEEQAKARGAKKFEIVDSSQIHGDYSNSMRANLSLASRTCEYISKRDGWTLNESSIVRAAKDLKLAGRFERRTLGDKLIILDGAHNTQKIEMLIDNLSTSYPDKVFNVLFASSKKREPAEKIELLAPITDELYLTKYSEFAGDERRGAIDFSEYSKKLESAQIIDDVDAAVKIIQQSKKDWLVTGSFFLVSEVGARLSNS